MQMTLEKMSFTHGCFDEQISYEKYINHLKNECGSKICCPIEEEYKNYTKRELQEHLEQNCPKMPMQCDNCAEYFPRENIKNHKIKKCLESLK
jgi:hypothetical protein